MAKKSNTTTAPEAGGNLTMFNSDHPARYPTGYWPVRTPAGYEERHHDIKEASCALFFAVKGLCAFAEENCLSNDDTIGVEWLARIVWEMGVQLDEEGDFNGIRKDAGKVGAS